MNRKPENCLDRVRPFDLSELFFSTTDPRGVIRYGNSVFTRVSGFETHELIGQAHSIVRHPDMPASIFRLFWGMLQAGDSIAAYVKNRAKAGEYYWVMAVATPIEDGYLSVRLKPSSELLEVVEGVYHRVLQDEQLAKHAGSNKDTVVQAGTRRLEAELKGLGFRDYPAFMRHALSQEVTQRHERLSHEIVQRGRNMLPQHKEQRTAPSPLRQLVKANSDCDSLFRNMLGHLHELRSSNRSFLTACDSLQRLSEAIEVIAMNGIVAANSPILSAVSGALAEAESDNRRAIKEMNGAVQTINEALEFLAFEVCMAALQSEVGTVFLDEIQSTSADTSTARENLAILISQADQRLNQLSDRLERTGNWFRQLEALQANLQRNAKTLRFIRMAGVTEATNLDSGHAFCGLFDSVKSHILETFDVCSTLSGQIRVCKNTINALTAIQDQLDQRTRQIKRQFADIANANSIFDPTYPTTSLTVLREAPGAAVTAELVPAGLR